MAPQLIAFIVHQLAIVLAADDELPASPDLIIDVLADVRAALRAGQRTPPVVELSRDPREAIAYAMAVIRADDTIDKRDALAQLGARIDRLVDAGSDGALRELAATLPLMETLMVRYAVDAVQAKNIDHKAKLTKLALQCQASFARTMALLATLRAQRTGKATVIVDDSN